MLTPHLHLLVPEAVWLGDGAVVPLAPPDDEEVASVLERCLKQVARDWGELQTPWAEDEYEELQARAAQTRLGFEEEPKPRARGKRVAVAHGFSLHADTAVHSNDREGLERLCRYLSPCQLASSQIGSAALPLRARRCDLMRGRRRAFAYSATTAARPVS